MTEIIDFINGWVAQNMYMGYAIHTILFIIISFWIKNNNLVSKLDEAANKVIAIAGIVFFVTWMTSILIFLNTADEEQKQHLLNRMFGMYWFGYWLEPSLKILAIQLLWLPKIQRSKIIRILISLLLLFSFERAIMFITSLHPDYLPSSWNSYTTPEGIIAGGLVSLVFFGAIVTVYLFISKLTGRKSLS